MIPRPIASFFPAEVRARGDRYVDERRVTLGPPSPGSLRAIVRGTESYVVALESRRKELVLHCSCPYAADNGFCKHLWATLRAADARGLLNPLVIAARTYVFADPFAEDGIVLDADGDDAAELDEDLFDGEPRRRPPTLEWRRVLDEAKQRAAFEPVPSEPVVWPKDRRLVYLVDLEASRATEGLAIDLATEKQRSDGGWDPPKLFRSGADVWLANPDPIDRQLAQMLRGASRAQTWAGGAWRESITGFVITPASFDTTIRLLCETGRFRVRQSSKDSKERHAEPGPPLRWDGAGIWRFRLRIERMSGNASEGERLTLAAVLARDDEEMVLTEPTLLHSSGLMIVDDSIARFTHDGSFGLVGQLRETGPVPFPVKDLPAVLSRVYALPRVPAIDLPAGVSVTQAAPAPIPVLHLSTSDGHDWARRYTARLEFDYDGVAIDAARRGETAFDESGLRVIHRDRSIEGRARERLLELGVREEYDWYTRGAAMLLAPSRFDTLLRTLADEGWRIVADGIPYRSATSIHARVRSGVDWFDLEGAVTFGDVDVPIPEVLEALKHGRTVVLADGSRGFISDEWRGRLAPLLAAADLGVGGNGARFRRSQTMLLDAMLASLPATHVDEQFARARTELQDFERIEAAPAPKTFRGTLRPYQRDGLGWLHFLRRFGLGGCLADDMGLGKTIQVLALLEARRLDGAGPSLVVVPRSLVFNWREEAARFTPELRVLDHTGAEREKEALRLDGVDLVMTTYGTLRRDVAQLREVEFDYVVLDESQAIKNATTASAKAARLLRGRHRLALSGTPIENRLEELWSLFEFLNPGMLGASAAFKRLARGPAAASKPAPGRALVARALRPVILRRTKEQVARELPERVEQTLLVELETPQRRVYDELLEHYRTSLLAHVDRVGIGRSKIQVLEALLRLRQAACHPGLIDKKRRDAPSAKLDVLVPKLVEAAAEGHKALVFSQFTSFLAFVRERLDVEKIPYEYLDGQTRDRQAVVSQFQQEGGRAIFLISLKAGGHGLNLTAADYVFLLDPWWNPAVEAQAIDRAHRIGQTRHVLATRFVAHDTVEEKILELQQSKRELADAILNEDQGLLAKIGREELAMLLG